MTHLSLIVSQLEEWSYMDRESIPRTESRISEEAEERFRRPLRLGWRQSRVAEAAKNSGPFGNIRPNARHFQNSEKWTLLKPSIWTRITQESDCNWNLRPLYRRLNGEADANVSGAESTNKQVAETAPSTIESIRQRWLNQDDWATWPMMRSRL